MNIIRNLSVYRESCRLINAAQTNSRRLIDSTRNFEFKEIFKAKKGEENGLNGRTVVNWTGIASTGITTMCLIVKPTAVFATTAIFGLSFSLSYFPEKNWDYRSFVVLTGVISSVATMACVATQTMSLLPVFALITTMAVCFAYKCIDQQKELEGEAREQKRIIDCIEEENSRIKEIVKNRDWVMEINQQLEKKLEKLIDKDKKMIIYNNELKETITNLNYLNMEKDEERERLLKEVIVSKLGSPEEIQETHKLKEQLVEFQNKEQQLTKDNKQLTKKVGELIKLKNNHEIEKFNAIRKVSKEKNAEKDKELTQLKKHVEEVQKFVKYRRDDSYNQKDASRAATIAFELNYTEEILKEIQKQIEKLKTKEEPVSKSA